MIETTEPTIPNTRLWLDFNDADQQSSLPRYDRDEIRAQLQNKIEQVVAYLFPHGKRRGAQYLVGNIEGDPGDSLVIELAGQKRGVWYDFATGDKGDVSALWAGARQFNLRFDFSELLADMAAWLHMPATCSVDLATTKAKPASYDALGPATDHWDYLDSQGQLLVRMYRYDTAKGKVFRPWDVQAGKYQMPNPRPLFNLPEIILNSAIVLVEGEKCAEALISQGIPATTAMGGALTAIDKTDWSPLAGKIVAVWPDNDEAGSKYAQAVIAKLQNMDAEVRLVSIPGEKPKKWDAADAVDEAFEVIDLLKRSAPIRSESAMASAQHRNIQFDIQNWHAVERFVGEPKPRRWLVEGIFPMAQPALVASAGGVGKSFLLLSLAREVAAYDGSWALAPYLFGGALRQQGVAIYVTAEDDAIEVHNRLNVLGDIPKNLYVIPLPDAGGTVPLFAPDAATRGPAATAAWQELERQLKAIADLRLVVLDPLQPLCALDLNVPENAQFVCSKLAALAATTGASVVVSHHFAKREASNPEQAREAIRGTGGLVDGVRSVYALWNPKLGEALDICEILQVDYQRGSVIQGGVVKANGKANLNVTTYLRDQNGLLVDQSNALRLANPTENDLLRELKWAIARAAVDGQPYTKTGGNGVYERRHELPELFHSVGKHKFSHWVGILLGKGDLVAAMAEGSKVVKWLDVPDGPVAIGEAEFRLGHLSRSESRKKAKVVEIDLL
jgi:hypothetical protein